MDTVVTCVSNCLPQPLCGAPIVGMQYLWRRGIDHVSVDAARQFTIVSLTRGFSGCSHEAFEMMSCLGQRDFEAVAAIPDTVGSVGESPGAFRRRMRECTHHQGGAGATNPPLYWDKGEVTDVIVDARVGLGFRRNQQLPISRGGDVLEEIYWGVYCPNYAMRSRPFNWTWRKVHQAPLSASR